jgi:DNA-binding response OmpR family regulator
MVLANMEKCLHSERSQQNTSSCDFRQKSSYYLSPTKSSNVLGKSMENPHPLKVLIVDDEESFRMSLEMALNMTKEFGVQSCDSAEAARALLKSSSFDAVILDYSMPDENGIDLLKWKQKVGNDVPVIMVTAAGSESVAVDAIKLGAYDYFRKDQIDIDKLPIAILSAHERYMYRKEVERREREAQMMREKEKDLDSLRTFEKTVTSISEFVENSLYAHNKSLQHHEEELLKFLPKDKQDLCKERFGELRQSVEVISDGMTSMRDLTTLVARKLEEIQEIQKSFQ